MVRGSGTLCSRWHVNALLARSNQHLLPPEDESIFVTGCPTEPANLAPFHFRYKQYKLPLSLNGGLTHFHFRTFAGLHNNPLRFA